MNKGGSYTHRLINDLTSSSAKHTPSSVHQMIAVDVLVIERKGDAIEESAVASPCRPSLQRERLFMRQTAVMDTQRNRGSLGTRFDVLWSRWKYSESGEQLEMHFRNKQEVSH